MQVIIDNSEEAEARFGFKANNEWAAVTLPREKKSLLEIFSLALKNRDQSFRDITHLAVVVSRGRFTAERVAVVMANALALALKIRLVKVNDFDFTAADQALAAAQFGYLLPEYSTGVHINGAVKHAI
ncbi:MAG: hypothetical protein Q7K39_00780 [Candidatus Magasanikbacteria bacterium]|nr:hypothetical protein [Candidatus Magasanikbacteria bacterium]